MLDLKYLRTNLDTVAQALLVKGYTLDVDKFRALDAERKESDIQSQELQAKRNKASKQIGELIKSGKSVDEAKAEVNETLALIDESLEQVKQRASDVEEKLRAFMFGIPNEPDSAVPPGNDESDNVEKCTWGTPKNFEFDVLDHVDLGAGINGLDFDAATKISGSRFSVLSGHVARLHRALGQFMLDLHTGQHGYREVNVPLIVNADSLTGTGQLPKFEEDLFKLNAEQQYYLIPTAEVPVSNLYRDSILTPEQLPGKFVAHTACFRSEAGSYGKDTRGLIRQHQFEKVELVQFVQPSESNDALEELTGHAEAVLQQLELPYRKVILCGGDLSFSSAKTYDLEVWLPGQACYREISSCSNFRSFQSRRMKTRWRNPESKSPELVHTLNGSGLAIGRTLVAVLENYQNADGSVSVPDVLKPYMGNIDRITAG